MEEIQREIAVGDDARTAIQFTAFPPALLPIIEAAVLREAWLIPNWCQDMLVRFGTNRPESVAEMTAEVDYRRATLLVNGTWFEPWYTDRERRDILLHEFCHLYVNAVSAFCWGEIERLLDDKESKHGATLREALRVRVEQVTQDLAYAITRKDRQAMPKVNGKRYPYTAAGKKAAAKARMKSGAKGKGGKRK